MSVSQDRPAIPEAIKRAVRQRCRFGCVICGIPLFHYDHIEEYADVREHEEKNLTLLCPNHHQMKTSGRLAKEVLAACNSNPFNLGKELTAKSAVSFVSAERAATFSAGGNTFIFPIVPGQLCPCITVDGEIVIGLTVEDGALLLDLKLHDRAGEAAIVSERGEVAINTGNWDYRLEGTSLSIRSAPRDIIVDLQYSSDGILLERGSIIGHDGARIMIADGKIYCQSTDGKTNVLTECCLFHGCGIIVSRGGISIGTPPSSVRGVPRLPRRLEEAFKRVTNSFR